LLRKKNKVITQTIKQLISKVVLMTVNSVHTNLKMAKLVTHVHSSVNIVKCKWLLLLLLNPHPHGPIGLECLRAG